MGACGFASTGVPGHPFASLVARYLQGHGEILAKNGGIMADSEMREFLLVIRRALLMIVRWIEGRPWFAHGKGDAGDLGTAKDE
jgi:hypothetical protein